MAEVFTVAMTNPFADLSGENIITIDWTSHASDGTCDGDICSTFAAAQLAIGYAMPQPSKVWGYIKAIETIPGANGDLSTTCPTALYDIVLQDAYDYDLAATSLADRSASVAERVIPTSPIPVNSEITLGISAAGTSTTGRILIYISPIP